MEARLGWEKDPEYVEAELSYQAFVVAAVRRSVDKGENDGSAQRQVAHFEDHVRSQPPIVCLHTRVLHMRYAAFLFLLYNADNMPLNSLKSPKDIPNAGVLRQTVRSKKALLPIIAKMPKQKQGRSMIGL